MISSSTIAPLLRKRLHVRVMAHARQLELHRAQRYRPRLSPRDGSPGEGRPDRSHGGVAHAAHAFVQLHDRLLHPRSLRPHLAYGVHQFLFAEQILPPQRMRHAHFGEDAPSAALGPEGVEIRIRRIHGDAQLKSDLPFQIGRIERDHMRPVQVRDQRADVSDDVRSGQQLPAQRLRGTVLQADEVQSFVRVRIDDAGQQAQVVVDNGWLDGQ